MLLFIILLVSLWWFDVLDMKMVNQWWLFKRYWFAYNIVFHRINYMALRTMCHLIINTCNQDILVAGNGFPVCIKHLNKSFTRSMIGLSIVEPLRSTLYWVKHHYVFPFNWKFVIIWSWWQLLNLIIFYRWANHLIHRSYFHGDMSSIFHFRKQLRLKIIWNR